MRHKSKRPDKKIIPKFQPEDILYILQTENEGILGFKPEKSPAAFLAWTAKEKALEYKKNEDLETYNIGEISYIYLLNDALKQNFNIIIDKFGIGDWEIVIRIDKFIEDFKDNAYEIILN